MDKLTIFKMFEKHNEEYDDNFLKGIYGNITYKNILEELRWTESGLKLIEETLPYIERIYEAPNRLIINEEEIVKIELAKRVTVESVKHLAKNTNFIQKVNEHNEVEPSKILNINKIESFDTYENRLIYTLVQNTKMFIKRKTDELMKNINSENEQDDNDKDNTKLEYNATSEVKDEKINVQVKLNSEIDPNGDESKDKNKLILDRIEEIKRKIDVVSNAEPYKVIDKLHITLVREPIRKTNVVLKNVNFQYAMKLWSYLRENFDETDLENTEENKDYMDQGELKQFIDEAFLLQYLAMKTIDEDRKENEATYQELKEKMVEQMLEKMVDMDEDKPENINDNGSTEQQLIQMISEKYEVIRYKKTEIIKEIQQIFKKYIEKYEEQVEKR